MSTVESTSTTALVETSASHSESRARPSTALLVALAGGVAAVLAGAAFILRERRRRRRNPYYPLVTRTTPTAQVTALMRHLHRDWEPVTPGVVRKGPNGEQFGEDRFAQYFLTAAQRAEVNKPGFRIRSEGMMSAVCNWLWSRTRVLDSELSRALADLTHPVHQLVLLGAGYDTRSYRFRQALDARGVRRFEVDLPVLQAAKQKAMLEVVAAEGDIGLDDVTFVPLDLSLPSAHLLSTMRAHGFDSARASVFIWEGVIVYLTRDAVIASLRFMAEGCPSGSLLLASFPTRPRTEARDNVEQRFRDEWSKNEPRRFFPTLVDFESILDQTGWRIERIYTPEKITAEYLSPTEGAALPGGHIVIARRV